MPEIKSKFWNGRRVLYERTFIKEAGVEWGAYYQAKQWMNENGYSDGSMDAGPQHNPIALVKGKYNLPQKWHNFTKEDKQKCDGVGNYIRVGTGVNIAPVFVKLMYIS